MSIFDGKPLPRVQWSEVNDPKSWTTQPCDPARLQRECLEAFAREQKRKLVEGRLGTYQGFTFVDRIARTAAEVKAAMARGLPFRVEIEIDDELEAVVKPPPHPNAQHAAPIARALRRSNARQTATAWDRGRDGA